MDSGATAHLSAVAGILQSNINSNIKHSVTVGNASKILVTTIGSTSFQTNTRPLSLQNVRATPNIFKNLIFVCKFTTNNWCSVEFDPFDFSVKELPTRKTLVQCESFGELYPHPATLNKPPTSSSTPFLALSPMLWNKRLGYTNNEALRSIISSNSILCNKDKIISSFESCQLWKQIKLPFVRSVSEITKPFEIIQYDVWTLPILSISGIWYYDLFLNHFSQFLWVTLLDAKAKYFQNSFTS